MIFRNIFPKIQLINKKIEKVDLNTVKKTPDRKVVHLKKIEDSKEINIIVTEEVEIQVELHPLVILAVLDKIKYI